MAERRRYWRPRSLPEDVDPRRLFYVVVDEMVGTALGLTVARWPRQGREGELHFADDEFETEVGADRDVLRQFLGARRAPHPRERAASTQEVRRRPVRIGDAFAVHTSRRAVTRAAKSEGVPDPSMWIEGPVWDVTADARDAAKAAYFRAVAAPLDPRVARKLADAVDEEPPVDPGPRTLS